MKNDVMDKPFPANLFDDLGHDAPTELADDFIASFMYVLYCVAPPRDVKVMLMRYRSGKSFDDIAESLNISRQRASAVVQEVLGRITSNHAEMLAKGIKKYHEDLLADRADRIANSLELSELETVRVDAYTKGFNDAKNGVEAKSNNNFSGVLIETLGMTTRTYNACKRNELLTLADILNVGDGILECRTFGAKCFHEIVSILETMNLDANTFFPRAIHKFGVEE